MENFVLDTALVIYWLNQYSLCLIYCKNMDPISGLYIMQV